MGYVEKDFLMRQFNQLGVVLARILGFKENGKFEEAQQTIDNALTDFGLKELEVYLKIDVKDLVDKLVISYKLNVDQIKVLAELLYEKGDICNKSGNSELSKAFLIRALKLYDYLTSAEKVFSFEREEKIKNIRSVLRS